MILLNSSLSSSITTHKFRDLVIKIFNIYFRIPYSLVISFIFCLSLDRLNLVTIVINTIYVSRLCELNFPPLVTWPIFSFRVQTQHQTRDLIYQDTLKNWDKEIDSIPLFVWTEWRLSSYQPCIVHKLLEQLNYLQLTCIRTTMIIYILIYVCIYILSKFLIPV